METDNKLEATIKFGGRYLNIKVPTMSQMNVMTRYLVSDVLCVRFRELQSMRPIRNILDIGANMGFLSILFSTAFPEASIYAMEPSLINCEYLTHNCKDFPNVSVIKKGAYSKSGYAYLAAPTVAQRDIPEWNMNTGQLSLYGKGSNKEVVELAKTDDLFDGADLIKIDVEGAELDVLRGSERILTEHKPILIVELRGDILCMSGRTVEQIMAYLENLGYRASGFFEQDLIFIHDGNNNSR